MPGFWDRFNRALGPGSEMGFRAAEASRGDELREALLLADRPYLKRGEAPPDMTATESLQGVPMQVTPPAPRRPGDFDPDMGDFTPPIETRADPAAGMMRGREALRSGIPALRESTGGDRYEQITDDYYTDRHQRPEYIEQQREMQEAAARDARIRGVVSQLGVPEDQVGLALALAGGDVDPDMLEYVGYERPTDRRRDDAAWEALGPDYAHLRETGVDPQELLEGDLEEKRDLRGYESRRKLDLRYRPPSRTGAGEGKLPTPLSLDQAMDQIREMYTEPITDQYGNVTGERLTLSPDDLQARAWDLYSRARTQARDLEKGGGGGPAPTSRAAGSLLGGSLFAAQDDQVPDRVSSEVNVMREEWDQAAEEMRTNNFSSTEIENYLGPRP